MSGLVLKLGPKERLLLNGAVIENGDRRTRITVLTPGANILRMKDALHPNEAKTPVKRVAYIAQLALCGDADPQEARRQLLTGIEQLSRALTDADSRLHLARATEAASEQRFYQALKALRALIPREDRLLARLQ